MSRIEICMRCRLGLMATAVVAWMISALADISMLTGLLGSEASVVASYATIIGITVMFAAAISAGYHLRFKLESRAAKGDLLDVGVMLAAVVLFTIVAIIRQNVSGSPLPLALTFLGVTGLITDFFVDLTDEALKKRRPL